MFQRQAQLSDSLEAEENAQRPTSNIQHPTLSYLNWTLGVRRCRPTSTTVKTRPKKPPKGTRRGKTRRWSAQVTKRSDALDLESDVFKGKDPHGIALSLKRSAQRSKRRKGTPYQSAMSMLNFYINRAGKNLPQRQRRILERAKDELREAFART